MIFTHLYSNNPFWVRYKKSTLQPYVPTGYISLHTQMSKNNTYLLALDKILKNHHREESGNQQEDADFEVLKASVAVIIAAMAQMPKCPNAMYFWS